MVLSPTPMTGIVGDSTKVSVMSGRRFAIAAAVIHPELPPPTIHIDFTLLYILHPIDS